MRIPLILLATLLLAACASHAVRCDTRLTPINLPAPVAHAAAAVASGGRAR